MGIFKQQDMKLQLYKRYEGRYENRAGDILVTVRKCYMDNTWRGTIEVFTHMAKDMFTKGNPQVEMFDELFTYTEKTKKDVSAVLVSYIENTLQEDLKKYD